MKTTKNTKTMQSITDSITPTMKQSFMEQRKTMTKDEILSHISAFSSRKVKKAWLTKRINDKVVYLNYVKQAATEGWKHFYGQPIHQKFVELQMETLQSMIDLRLKLSPESERESLFETYVGALGKSQPKVVSKTAPKPQPKVVETKVEPKVQPKVAKAKPQPKVETDQMTQVINLLGEVTKQVTTCLNKLVEHSNQIAELQKAVNQPKVVTQPKVVKAKTQPKVTEQPKVETVKVKAQPKVVKKKQPKIADTEVSLFKAFFSSLAPKTEKKSTISHESAFEHRTDVERASWKKYRMEVK